jgi:hypothetical protein
LDVIFVKSNFCTKCGVEVNQTDQYCSSCGEQLGAKKVVYQPYSASPDPTYALEQVRQHIKILGLVELSFGIITLFGIAIAAIVMTIVLSPEFYHLIETQASAEIPFDLSLLFNIIWVILLLVGISGIIDIIGGILLINQKRSGRIITYISAVLSFLNFPIGTIYAIGAFWVLTKPETDQILK